MNTEKKKKVRKINAAAYCRVSTAQEDREASCKVQAAYFTKLVTESPSWNLAGIYADDGIPGADMKKRDNFNAMIERCLQKDGDIDLILAKSINRLAGDTVDCLSCIRKLKEQSIAICFEKEYINTLESKGKLLTTVPGSQVQEESQSISENVKRGLKRKYEKGEVLVRRVFGCGKGINGQLYIALEGAEMVQLIYGKYLEGESLSSIARLLKEEGTKTIRGSIEWNMSSIRIILVNGKYISDAMAQKTFITDYLIKTRKENQGEFQKYYVENARETIIPREVFYKAQEELRQRANICKKSSKKEIESKDRHTGKYTLSKVTVCKGCDCEYRRQIWSRYGEEEVVWRCENKLRNRTRYYKDLLIIEENILRRVVLYAINQVLENKGDFVQTFRKNVVTAPTHGAEDSEYAREKKKLQRGMAELIQQRARQSGGKTTSEEHCQTITTWVEALEMKQIRTASRDEKGRKMEDIEDFLDKANCILTEYNGKLVRQSTENINAVDAREVGVVFKSGITVEEMLPEYQTNKNGVKSQSSLLTLKHILKRHRVIKGRKLNYIKTSIGKVSDTCFIPNILSKLIFSHFRNMIQFECIPVYEGDNMAVSYEKPFHVVIERDVSNIQLMKQVGFSANITIRMKKGSYISLENVESICRAMCYGVDDILEFIPDEHEKVNKQ